MDQSSSPATSTSSEAESLTSEVSEARREYLAEFIPSGPIFQRAELIMTSEDDGYCTTDSFQTCLDDWIQTGAILQDALGSQANDVRIFHYYLPVFFWVLRELDRHLDNIIDSGATRRPFVLGFSCPQGGGKTTMTTFLETLLRTMGKNVQIASLDDFYVTNAEQRLIAQKYPDNRLMQYRGMPGTHDLELLNETLDKIRQGHHEVSIPKYDKTAFAGRGDRAPETAWKHISETTDVFLLEGWCLGFEPVHEDKLIDRDLVTVNKALHDFVSVYSRLDGLFLIEISNMDWVYDWRLQAEHATRAAGRPCLTDEQVIDFIDRFMPAYKQYSKQLYKRPTPVVPNHELHIEIDENRCPVHQKQNGV